MPFTRNGTTPSHLGARLLIDAIIYACLLKQEVGLGDFEGRGWRGFHHHLTLSFAAYGFLVMRRCQQPWPAGGRAGVLSFPVVADPTHPPIRPERHAPTSIPTMRRRLTVGLA